MSTDKALNIKMTDRELRLRQEQFLRDMEPFTAQLIHIHNIMPLKGYILYADGSFQQLPPDPEWQAMIDRVNKQKDEFIAIYYPEIKARQDNCPYCGDPECTSDHK